MPIKLQLVLRQLGSLRRYVELLRPLQSESLADLSRDRLRWYGLLHVLQMLVEHVTDIGNHLLAGINEHVTDDARETIQTMGRAGLLPPEFAARIAPVIGFRNVVVHEYLTVDPAIVYHVLQNGLGEFEQFARYVEEYLRREGHLRPVEPTV
jgi:uncharacterized protein YutE (UPF0331/DUF86 family)